MNRILERMISSAGGHTIILGALLVAMLLSGCSKSSSRSSVEQPVDELQ